MYRKIGENDSFCIGIFTLNQMKARQRNYRITQAADSIDENPTGFCIRNHSKVSGLATHHQGLRYVLDEPQQ